MKKLAIIGASYLQEPIVKKAKQMGIYTICFAWADGATSWSVPCSDDMTRWKMAKLAESEDV